MFSLAVMWSEDGGPARPGRLELAGSTLRFEGGSHGAAHGREVPLADVARAYVGRKPEERIGGRSTLVLELRAGGTLRMAGVGRPAALGELTERILEAVAG